MEILAEFPKQVLVLRDTQTICGLRGRSTGLQRLLIDADQTRQFESYCRRLDVAKQGDRKFEDYLLRLGRAAEDQMERVLADATKMSDNFEKLAKTFSDAEIRALRTGDPLTEQMAEKILQSILWGAAFMFRDHPRVQKLPPGEGATNTYIFRAAICLILWALDWISVGGAKGVKAERLRNDMVDISFATYASFFNGLLTADKKLIALHRDSVLLRRALFDAKSK